MRVVGAVKRLEEVVGQARGVGEQVTDGDGGGRAVGRLRFEGRQEIGDSAVEREFAEFDHSHRGGGDDRLGDGSEAEDVVFLHRAAGLAVRLAIGLEVGDLALPHYGDHSADDALVVEGGGDGGVDALGEICHGEQGETASAHLSSGGPQHFQRLNPPAGG
jgi:hypothetical protein